MDLLNAVRALQGVALCNGIDPGALLQVNRRRLVRPNELAEKDEWELGRTRCRGWSGCRGGTPVLAREHPVRRLPFYGGATELVLPVCSLCERISCPLLSDRFRQGAERNDCGTDKSQSRSVNRLWHIGIREKKAGLEGPPLFHSALVQGFEMDHVMSGTAGRYPLWHPITPQVDWMVSPPMVHV